MRIKHIILIVKIFIFQIGLAQTQIGQDIDGEDQFNQFGHSVSLSGNGNIVAIGGPENNGNGDKSGHVRVYENNSGTWMQIGQDIDGESADDRFGFSVSLSNDGTILAIGATGNDGNGDRSGHVRVYENVTGSWTQIGQDIDGEAAEDLFGFEVSLSCNGNIVAVGGPLNDGNGDRSGHVRVYENISGTWIQVGQDIDGEAPEDRAGNSVSLSCNGSIVAVGSPQNDGNGNASGHVRVYENISGNWTQIGIDIDGEAAGDSAHEVAISSNGNIIAVGAYQNDGNGNASGHVRVYENNSGFWVQIGQDIDGEAAVDNSGWFVSLSGDGDIVAIGADNANDDQGIDKGHVRVYRNNSGVWTQIGSDIDGEAYYDLFGYSVSLSNDGQTLVAGAIFNDGNGPFSGHARVFDLSTSLNISELKTNSISIYPNPAKSAINIKAKNFINKIVVYDLSGKQIKSKQPNRNVLDYKLDIKDLSIGIYFLEIQSAISIHRLKFIKN